MPEREDYVKGSLAHLPLPKTLNYIHQAAKTGILAIVRGPKKVHIHLDAGQVVHVTSSYFPGLSLGEYLIKQRKISQEISAESYEKTRAGNTRQGMWLVEHEYLSPHELYDALNTHVTLKLYTLFEWPEGDFFFKQGEIIEQEHRVLKTHMGNLIYIGIRDHFPMTTLPTEFRGRKETLMFKRPDCRYREEDMAFGPMGTRVISLINGQHTLRQIVSLTKFKKSIAYKMIYAMYLLGFIGFPESVVQRESKKGSRFQERVLQEQETKARMRKSEGFEINIADNIISEAVKSVERIHETVKGVDSGFEETSEDMTVALNAAQIRTETKSFRAPKPAMPSEPALTKPVEPVEEEFGLKLDEPGKAADDFFASKPSSSAEAPAEEFAWEEPAESAALGDLGESEPLDSYTSFESDDLQEYKSAADLLKQASYFINENRYEDAERYLNRAIELDANYAEAYPPLGWCIYNRSNGGEVRDAEQTIKKGIKLNPQMFQAFLYLGKIYKAEKQPEFAELHFVKAIELNVDCTEAKEEIKRIRIR
jgi:tetratricopeptide (TPR) repeat protein